MAVPSNDAKSTKPTVPSEIKIIAGIEAFSGLVYLVNFLVLLSIIFSPILLFLCCLSFTIAYGLWRIKKWAWFLSLILSIFGAGSGIFVLAFTGVSESSLLGGAPMIILDVIVVIMLLSKDVRRAFRV
ncbi:MAG: hypothetical protein H5T34_05675 [Candidatus Methanomethyliales bacterium]|nr:hypothetical protein [Candidatus Methanomethylicales archaeon]